MFTYSILALCLCSLEMAKTSAVDETYVHEKMRLHEQLTQCQAALADTSTKHSQATADVTRLLRDLETAQDELNSFKMNASSMARAYEEENGRLNDEVMRLSELLAATTNDVDMKLSTANEREKSLKSELAAALVDGQALQDTSDDLVRTNDALQVAQRRCNNLIDELDHAEQACGEKDARIAQLQQQTVQLAEERAVLAVARRDVITTNGQLTATQEERDQLLSMNNGQKQRIDSLIFELQEATNRVASMNCDFNAVNDDADSLRLQIINDARRR